MARDALKVLAVSRANTSDHARRDRNIGAKDASGEVTLQSLYGYLMPNVMDDARRANRDQTPELRLDSAAAGTVLRER